MERCRYLVSGRVQGVGFRFYTVAVAGEVGRLAGFVRNLPDGRVEIVAEGAAADLARFEGALYAGRLGGHIAGLRRQAGPARGRLSGFTIRF